MAAEPAPWAPRKIGEFAARSKVINEEGTQLPPLSITKDRGVVLQSEKYKKQIATDLRKYVIARRDQFAFDPMSLYYGAIGRVARIDIGLVSPDYVVFDVDDTVDKTFLNYLLRSPSQIAAYEAVAETGNSFGKRRRVYWSVLEQLAVHMPPLGEQRKIAAILSAVDTAIEATQTVIQQLQVVKQAMMAALLTRGLPGRHTQFKRTELGEVPEGWEISRLDAVATLTAGGTPSRSIQANYGGAIPWVKSGEVDCPWIVTTDETLSELGLLSSAAKWVEPGSVLVAMYGATAGKVGMLGIRATTNQAVCAISGNSQRTNNAFLYWVLLAATPTLLRTVQGSGQPNLNAGMIRSLVVALPPLDEQAAIAGVLGSLSARISAEEEVATHHRRLRAAVVHSLLTGEIRVIPDVGVT